jgi:HSP20 family protein
MALNKNSRSKSQKPRPPTTQPPVRSGSSGASSRAPAPWDDLDRLFDDFLRRRWQPFPWDWSGLRDLPALADARTPSLDIVDEGDEILVRAEVPGIDKKDLDISLDERLLTIKGRSREEKKETKGDYYRQEIKTGAFSRSVILPADVESGKAQADYKDGVVELRLPKAKGAARQRIDVR